MNRESQKAMFAGNKGRSIFVSKRGNWVGAVTTSTGKGETIHLIKGADTEESRKNIIKGLRRHIDDLKKGKTEKDYDFMAGNGTRIRLEKEFDYPENETQRIYKYGFGTKRRPVIRVRTVDKKGDVVYHKRTVPIGKWQKDPNYHGRKD